MDRRVLVAAIGVAVLLIAIIVILFLIPVEARVALRDIAIIFMVLLGIVSTVLLAVLVAALITVVFLLRDKIVPSLEQVNQTVNRVRGTTEFVSDEVVQPIIGAAGKLARVRAVTRSALGRDRR